MLVLAAALAPALAGASLERAMQLNRSGRWVEAAEEAGAFLAAHPEAGLLERCEALFDIAYANVRLGRNDVADETLVRYHRECAEVPKAHWLRREVAWLSGEPVPARRDDGFWRVATPAELGLDPDVLERHRALCETTGADACLVVRGGRIGSEWYSRRFRPPMYAMSATKSIAGLLFGMLADDGKLAVDDTVCKHLPAWCDDARRGVTLGHLLTHTSGLVRLHEDGVGHVADKNPFVLALVPRHAPGSRWDYSNEGVQLLSPILDRAAEEPIQDYARRRLFEPLGMTETRLHVDTAGHAWTYADMKTTPRDLARIGLLMLERGRWGERRVLSERWVERSTTASQPLNPSYGLLWWLYDEPRGFAALGYLENNLYVFPSQELVIVRMQAAPGPVAGEPYERPARELFRRMVVKNPAAQPTIPIS